jgi:hypothetical protein
LGSSSPFGSDNFVGAIADKLKDRLTRELRKRTFARVKRGVVCTNLKELMFTPDVSTPADDPTSFSVNFTYFTYYLGGQHALFLVLGTQGERARVLCLYTGETGTVDRLGLVPYK